MPLLNPSDLPQRELLRRMERAARYQHGALGQFEAANQRALATSAREQFEEEQDRRRINLAEQLTLIGCEGTDPRSYESVAQQAMSAASVIYPELPPEDLSAKEE